MFLIQVFLNPGYWAGAFRMTTPIYYAALGGVLAQRSGVMNLGLEGLMLFGGLSATLTTIWTGSLAMGVLSALAVGAILGYLLGMATVFMKSDQIVTGVAFNILALGVTGFFRGVFFGQSSGLNATKTDILPQYHIPVLENIPVLGWIISGQNVLYYLVIVFGVVSAIIMYRTRWGLALRICGENARAADMLGINVDRLRSLMMLASGALAGLGGCFLTIGHVGFYTENIASGRGYIAIAAVLLGRWHPLYALAACLLFGAADAIQYRVQTLGIGIPAQFPLMLPYLATIAAMIFFFRGIVGPAEEGKPYIKERR